MAPPTQDGQYFFDIFTTDGFLGDIPLVNFAYAPFFEVLPRKYRFRILAAGMSRYWKLALAGPTGNAVPFKFIANDGNLTVNPILLTSLDEQGVAERYDIVVDFSSFRIGDKIKLVNTLTMRDDGRGPAGALTLAQALAGIPSDPCVGAIMEFRVVSSLPSVDAPGQTLTTANSCGANDKSQVPLVLTQQIPIVAPVRTRLVEFGRSGGGDSRDPVTGQCTPDCPEGMPFPWTIKVNGEDAHSFNANRVSMVIPKPGEIEHWTYVNGGGGWDHPIHLHFEEGVTMNRGVAPIPATERLVRKDVWRLLPSGSVQFQVQFGEYGGSYVNHCHNTVHEDFALLMRHQSSLRSRAAGGGDADAEPDARRRVLHDAGNSARRGSENQLLIRRLQDLEGKPNTTLMEEKMKRAYTPLKLAIAAALLAAAYAIAGTSASAQDATTSTTTTTATTATTTVPRMTATPAMIADAVARSKARHDKFLATGTPEQFGSEEPFASSNTK